MFIDMLTISKTEALRRLSSSLEFGIGGGGFCNISCEDCILDYDAYSNRNTRSSCSRRASGSELTTPASLALAAIEFADAGEEF